MILVTGGAGFVGRALVSQLRENQMPIRIADVRRPDYIPESEYERGKLEYVVVDVTSPGEMKRALHDVETVYHLAAKLLLAGDRHEMQRVNVEGTRTVLEQAQQCRVKKVVYISTGMLYGHQVGRFSTEDDVPSPSGPYGKSKVLAEAVCRSYVRAGTNLTILRPLFVIGQGRLGVLHLIFDRLLRNRPIYLVGSGENRFHMIGVEDLARACIAASSSQASGIFNVGVQYPTSVLSQLEFLRTHIGSSSSIRPVPPSVVQLATRVLSRFGLSPIEDEQQRVAGQDRVLDTTRSKSVLGFVPLKRDHELMREAFDAWLVRKSLPRNHAADWPNGGIFRYRWIDRLL